MKPLHLLALVILLIPLAACTTPNPTDREIYAQHNTIDQSRSRATVQQSTSNTELRTPYTPIMSYPSDWPEQTRRRQPVPSAE